MKTIFGVLVFVGMLSIAMVFVAILVAVSLRDWMMAGGLLAILLLFLVCVSEGVKVLRR